MNRTHLQSVLWVILIIFSINKEVIAMSKVASGTISFRGQITDDSIPYEDLLEIKFEPTVDAEFPYRIYSKMNSKKFMSGHADLATAQKQSRNFPKTAYY